LTGNRLAQDSQRILADILLTGRGVAGLRSIGLLRPDGKAVGLNLLLVEGTDQIEPRSEKPRRK
jgi:hypothetical protein